MVLYEDKSEEIKLLEGRRKYYLGNELRRKYLPIILSGICGAICAFTAGMTYMASHGHSGSSSVVTSGASAHLKSNPVEGKEGLGPSMDVLPPSDSGDKKAEPYVEPSFANMVPQLKDVEAKIESEDKKKVSHEGWNAPSSGRPFANMVPHHDTFKTENSGPPEEPKAEKAGESPVGEGESEPASKGVDAGVGKDMEVEAGPNPDEGQGGGIESGTEGQGGVGPTGDGQSEETGLKQVGNGLDGEEQGELASNAAAEAGNQDEEDKSEETKTPAEEVNQESSEEEIQTLINQVLNDVDDEAEESEGEEEETESEAGEGNGEENSEENSEENGEENSEENGEDNGEENGEGNIEGNGEEHSEGNGVENIEATEPTKEAENQEAASDFNIAVEKTNNEENSKNNGENKQKQTEIGAVQTPEAIPNIDGVEGLDTKQEERVGTVEKKLPETGELANQEPAFILDNVKGLEASNEETGEKHAEENVVQHEQPETEGNQDVAAKLNIVEGENSSESENNVEEVAQQTGVETQAAGVEMSVEEDEQIDSAEDEDESGEEEEGNDDVILTGTEDSGETEEADEGEIIGGDDDEHPTETGDGQDGENVVGGPGEIPEGDESATILDDNDDDGSEIIEDDDNAEKDILKEHFTTLVEQFKKDPEIRKLLKGIIADHDYHDTEVDKEYDRLLAEDSKLRSLPKRYELRNKRKIGKTFKKAIIAWSKLADDVKYAEPFAMSIALDNMVFVTGVSSNHFFESQDGIAGIQKVFPHSRILYYDIGLDPYQASQVKEWCNVIYKKIDLSQYPEHVRKLHTYAFKPLIIKEVLNEHANLLWFDASFRPGNGELQQIYDFAKKYGGIILGHDSTDNVTSATHPGLYTYIPTVKFKLRQVTMASAGVLFIRNTPRIYWGIMYWWFLCALEEDCIAPKNAQLECLISEEAGKEKPGTYHHCHRFDQSALNVLLANYFQFDRSKYLPKYATRRSLIQGLERRVTHENTLQRCV